VQLKRSLRDLKLAERGNGLNCAASAWWNCSEGAQIQAGWHGG
jgi:hypothetical protein